MLYQKEPLRTLIKYSFTEESLVYYLEVFIDSLDLGQASCFVHHGGFGSTAAAFQAGIPAVVIPHIIDQFIWGSKVYELGVGPRPIPRTKLTEDNLAAAFKEAVNSKEMQENSARLGELIRAENGLENAVHLIKDVL